MTNPSLLKTLRNLMKHNLETDNGTVSFKQSLKESPTAFSELKTTGLLCFCRRSVKAGVIVLKKATLAKRKWLHSVKICKIVKFV